MLNQHQPKQHLSVLLAAVLTVACIPGAFAAGNMSTTQSSQTHTMMQMPGTTGTTNGSLYQQETTVSTTSQQNVVTIPAGTSLTVQPTGQAPDSLGDTFTGQLVNPVTVNGVQVIPAGSQVRGSVIGVNDSMNTMDIQFREISTTTGDTIPIRSRSTVNRIYGGVQQTGVQGTQVGQVAQTTNLGTTLYPRVTIGRPATTPAGRIIAGTVGGAALGAATGTLTGLVWPAVYRDDINFGEGTGAVRGLAWGAIFGSGLGLISGLIAAAADRDDIAVTTTQQPRQMHPMTNISTGALEEIPVAYSTTGGVTTGMQGQPFTIILEEPVTVTR